MKAILLIGLFYLSFIVSAIWAIVEFVIYIAKDDSFNWNSIWCTILGFFLMIIAFVLKAAMVEKYAQEQRKEFEKAKSERIMKWGNERSRKLEEMKQQLKNR